MILASIRSLSYAPCPTCRIPKDRGHELGTKRYSNDISRLSRQDTHSHRCTIQRVRELIFQEGFNVKSAGVERLLASESLAPIRVRVLQLSSRCFIADVFTRVNLECIFFVASSIRDELFRIIWTVCVQLRELALGGLSGILFGTSCTSQ